MKRLYYDIKAFFILRSEVKKHKNDPDWARFGLRHDWLYRVYTVINPSLSDKGDDEAMINMKAIDKVTPISKYIAGMGLSEVVSLSMEKVPNTDSYLVVYYQIYQWFTLWKIISRPIFIGLAAWALTHYWNQIISVIPQNLF
jgi:hypothetical protein